MICAVHHKLDTCRYLTEFAYDKPVTVPFVMMRNVAFKIRVGNVGKIADYSTPLCFKADNRFVQKRILSRRTTAVGLAPCKGVQRRENLFLCEDIGGFGTEGSIY